eukprot:6495202-Lingulodinium_polyedra.AAC.1
MLRRARTNPEVTAAAAAARTSHAQSGPSAPRPLAAHVEPWERVTSAGPPLTPLPRTLGTTATGGRTPRGTSPHRRQSWHRPPRTDRRSGLPRSGRPDGVPLHG